MDAYLENGNGFGVALEGATGSRTQVVGVIKIHVRVLRSRYSNYSSVYEPWVNSEDLFHTLSTSATPPKCKCGVSYFVVLSWHFDLGSLQLN